MSEIQLAHERLDVYQAAIQFLSLSVKAIELLPVGHAHISDQLKRAALSIVLNIAEGAGKTGIADKKKFFSIARDSATECGAVLDVLRVLKLLDEVTFIEGKQLLVRVVSMLSKMVL